MAAALNCVCHQKEAGRGGLALVKPPLLVLAWPSCQLLLHPTPELMPAAPPELLPSTRLLAGITLLLVSITLAKGSYSLPPLEPTPSSITIARICASGFSELEATPVVSCCLLSSPVLAATISYWHFIMDTAWAVLSVVPDN